MLETCRVLPSNKEHNKLHLIGYLYDHYKHRLMLFKNVADVQEFGAEEDI